MIQVKKVSELLMQNFIIFLSSNLFVSWWIADLRRSVMTRLQLKTRIPALSSVGDLIRQSQILATPTSTVWTKWTLQRYLNVTPFTSSFFIGGEMECVPISSESARNFNNFIPLFKFYATKVWKFSSCTSERSRILEIVLIWGSHLKAP